MHFDNSACNLASINLLKYLDDDGTFDVEASGTPSRSCSPRRRSSSATADYPTEKIAETSRNFRQLGPRLRQPRRAADGPRPAVRLRRRSRVGGGDHVADDRPRLRDERPHGGAHGSVRRVRGEPRADAERAADAPRRSRRIDEELVPDELLRPPSSRGRRGRARRGHGVRNSQASVSGSDGDNRPHDGLRHHRHRARPRAHQGEEARRWRHDVDRQPDDPAALRQLGYDDDAGRRDRRPHRRAEDDRRCAPLSRPSTCRCSPARWATTRSTTWAT